MMRSINVFSVSIVLMLSACGPSGEQTAFGTDRSGSPIISREPDEEAEGLSTARSGEARAAGNAALSASSQTHAATSTDAPPANLIGSWTSPSCGERTYPRKIQFDAAGHFAAQDLVSPCPPDVVCFWSGILHHRGDYQVLETKIKLELSEPRTSTPRPFPEELLIVSSTGSLAERTPSGELCTYVRDEAPTAAPLPEPAPTL